MFFKLKYHRKEKKKYTMLDFALKNKEMVVFIGLLD